MPTEDAHAKPIEAASAPIAPAPKPTESAPPKSRQRRIVIVAIAAAVVLLIGLPFFLRALHTVSTDDAYVNSHVTFVAPRVAGQVTRVLVDDNNRVRKGDLLVQIDPEPFKVQVAIKQAAVVTAEANLAVAKATVRRAGRAGAQPALQAAARDGGRGQSGRAHPRARRHVGAKQGHAGAGPGGIRPREVDCWPARS